MEEHRAALARAVAGASPYPKRGRADWAAARSPGKDPAPTDPGGSVDAASSAADSAAEDGNEDEAIESEPMYSGIMVFRVSRASGVPAPESDWGTAKRRPYVRLALMDSVKDVQVAASRSGTARQATGEDG